MIILQQLFIASQFLLDFTAPDVTTKQKGKGLEKQLEHLSTKIQESSSNVAITEKNEKQYVRLYLSIPETHGEFSDKIAPNIDGYTNEPVVQCDTVVVKTVLYMISSK